MHPVSSTWLLCLAAVVVDGHVCVHCHCDRHTASVTCTGDNVMLRSLTLPTWADSLYIHHMSLRHLPHFTFNDNVKVLRINHCGLTHIHPLSLSTLPNLETVHLADNLLTQLPAECFAQLTRLRILNLARNLITDLGQFTHLLRGDHVLDQLNLDGNRLEAGADTVRLPLARQWHLADTNIEAINGTMITFRGSATCPSNVACRSAAVPQQQWSILRALDLSANQLNVHPSALDMMSSIWNVNLATARLPPSFANWLSTSSHVRHLNLSAASLSEPSDEWPWCGENLEWLDVSSMRLRRLTVRADCRIRYLNANNNSIESAYLGSTQLETVLLERNKFRSWLVPPSGVALTQLHTLSLRHNLVEYLPDGALTHYPQLQNLDVSSNVLRNVSTASFPSIGMQLRSLNVSHNQLVAFVHPVLPSLLLLDLSFNQLSSLDPELLAGLPLLQHFYLSSNVAIFSKCRRHSCWLSALNEMLNLIVLDLSNCRLTQLPDLSPFEALRKLDLSHNKLSTFDAHLLPTSLQRLDISQNRIHSVFNFSAKRASALVEVDASRNPFVCECALAELAKLVDKRQLQNADEYYCFSGSWQYPLHSYLDNVHSCIKPSARLLPALLSILFLLIVAVSLVVFSALFVCRCNNKHWIPVPFTYRPLATADAISVDL